jgi:3-deoxy-7-phosphoheptulonate synthase
LPVVTEVMEPDKVGLVAEYADVIQIGARNVQNFSLLKRVAEVRKPVMLKRGMATSIQEWLLSAEYIPATAPATGNMWKRWPAPGWRRAPTAF